MILIQLLAFTKYKIPYLKWGNETKAQIKRTCCPQNLIDSLQWDLFKHVFQTSLNLHFFLGSSKERKYEQAFFFLKVLP